jgi:hypothetical protein
MTGSTKWTGRRERSEKTVTPEKLALLVDLLPTALSLRDIGTILGLRVDQVHRAAAPFLAIMKIAGTHPKCGCGKDRFHLYGCVDSYAKGSRDGLLPGRTRAEAEVLRWRRELGIEMIKSGVRWCDIDEALGSWKGTARRYMRFMTPEDRQARRLLDDARRDDLRRAGRRENSLSNPDKRESKPEPPCPTLRRGGRSPDQSRQNPLSDILPIGIAA